jgi:septation ring formation regulator EzrA
MIMEDSPIPEIDALIEKLERLEKAEKEAKEAKAAKLEEKISTVQRMVEAHLPPEQISYFTNTPLADVQSICAGTQTGTAGIRV